MCLAFESKNPPLNDREGLLTPPIHNSISVSIATLVFSMRFDDNMDRDQAVGGGAGANSSSDFVSPSPDVRPNGDWLTILKVRKLYKYAYQPRT